MYYNYIRFGSFFEFGAGYQMTGYDVRFQKPDPNVLLQAEAISFFTLPAFHAEFPWFSESVSFVNHSGNFSHPRPMLGVIAFPITWGFLFAGRARQSRKEESFWFVWGGCLSGALTAFLDFCMGGVMLRYISDYLPAFALIGMVGWLTADLPAGTEGKQTAAPGSFSPFCLLMCLLSMTISFCVAWEYIKPCEPDRFLFLARMLGC